MKIKLYNLIVGVVLFVFSAIGLVLFSIAFLPFNNIQSIFKQLLGTDLNPAIWGNFDLFQARCLYAGLFLTTLIVLLLWYRKNLILGCDKFSEKVKEIRKRSTTSFKNQLSASQLKYSLIIGTIFLFSILIRLFYIGSPLRYDEGFTFYYYCKKPLLLIVSYYDYPNLHILYALLAKISIFIFGDSPFSLRLPAFISGVLLIPLVYSYGAKFFSKNVAIISTTMVAVSSILISYSVNARGYTMNYCAFIILVYLAEMLKKNNSKFIWSIFIFVQLIGIYTIPTMLYGAIIVYTYLALSIIKKNDNSSFLKNMISSIVITGFGSVLLYLPVYIVMGAKAVVANHVVESHSYTFVFSNILGSLYEIYTMFCTDIPVVLQIFMLTGIVVSFVVNKQCRYLFYSILILLACVFFIQRVVPFTRVFVFLLPLFFIFSAVGITHVITLIPKVKHYWITGLICFFILVIESFTIIKSNSPTLKFDVTPIKNHREVFTYLKKTVRQNDRLLCLFPMESSVNSYFYFNQIPQSILKNDIFKSEKVFVVVGKRFLQNVNMILTKNQMDTTLFIKTFHVQSIVSFNDKTVVYEFCRK